MFRKILASLICVLCTSPLISALTIEFSEAAKHVGEDVVVTGKVSRVSTVASGMTFVNFGARGDAGGFTVVARPGAIDGEKLKIFEGKLVEVSGTIALYKDSPQIVLKSEADIRLQGEGATEGEAPAEADAKPMEEKAPVDAAAALNIETLKIELERGEIKTIGRIPEGIDAKNATAVVAFPEGMEAGKPHPILAVFPDFHSDNDLTKLITPYAKVANSRGWIVMAARGSSLDFALPPAWHTVMFQAALRELEKDYAGISGWPIYVAGNGDGAGRATISIGAFLDEKLDLRGGFLTSLKREELTKSAQIFNPSSTKLRKMKVFVSHGSGDGMVSEKDSFAQAELLKEAGIKTLKYETHGGRTGVDAKSLEKAIEWFEADVEP